MATGAITTNPKIQFSNAAGIPLAGGTVTVYVAGTTTPTDTWFAKTLTNDNKNTNPIVLDSRGECVIWLSQDVVYKFVLADSLGNVQWTVDNIAGAEQAGAVTRFALDLANKTDPAKGAGLVGFNPTLDYAGGSVGATFVEWNPKDYPWLAKFDGVTDDTDAITACIEDIYSAGGGTMRMPKGTAKVSSIQFNWTGSRTINIVGDGQNATYLEKIAGTSTPVLDLSVDVGVLDVYSTFRDFSIVGNAKGHAGFRATRLANITTENLGITVCDVAFDSVGCLVSNHLRPKWNSNNIGFRCRKSGSVYANLVSFEAGGIKDNTTHGMDIGDGSMIRIGTVDIELNGTSGDATTGGLVIRDTVDDEIGLAIIQLDGTWFEANLGTTIRTENASGLTLSLRGVNMLTNQAGRAATIGNISGVTFLDCNAPSPGDTVTIGTAGKSWICGGVINTITDSSFNVSRGPVTTGTGVLPGEFTRLQAATLGVGSGGITLNTSALVLPTGTFNNDGLLLQMQGAEAVGNKVEFFQTNGGGANAAATCIRIGVSSTTGRSINAGGTINASGADYAEYMHKADGCGEIAKGQIVGINSAGLITDRWADAVSFAVKSTSPSYVGGDIWGTEEAIGLRHPGELKKDATSDEAESHREALEQFNAVLETARRKVDRIAFAGQVPVNFDGATPGQFLVPIDDDGAIGCVAKNETDLSIIDYVRSVGKVIAIEADGRPRVIVKVA